MHSELARKQEVFKNKVPESSRSKNTPYNTVIQYFNSANTSMSQKNPNLSYFNTPKQLIIVASGKTPELEALHIKKRLVDL